MSNFGPIICLKLKSSWERWWCKKIPDDRSRWKLDPKQFFRITIYKCKTQKPLLEVPTNSASTKYRQEIKIGSKRIIKTLEMWSNSSMDNNPLIQAQGS